MPYEYPIATKMLRKIPILIAHRTCRGLGRQSETNRVMRSPARSRGDFGSLSIQPPLSEKKYGSS
jgi:hypothetical protein